MVGIILQHRLEKCDALRAVKTNLSQIADIALQHIVQQSRILGIERKAWQQWRVRIVTIAYVEPGTIPVLIIGREA